MSVKTYTLGKHKQLIDLNGDLTNFEITVTVTAKDPKSVFDVVVIDEASLNNTQTLEYKQATGAISSTIVNDNNIHKNYYIVMKADPPCQVDLAIEKQEIAPKPREQPSTLKQRNIPVKGQINWGMILVIGALVGVGLYFFVFSGKNKETSSYNYEKPTMTSVTPSIPSSIPSSVPSSVPLSNMVSSAFQTPSVPTPSIPTPSVPSTSQTGGSDMCETVSSLFEKLRQRIPED